MGKPAVQPNIEDIAHGGISFSPKMPIWKGKYCESEWRYLDSSSPLHRGDRYAAIFWDDFLGDSRRAKNPSYAYCLTKQMITDLKIAAAILVLYPKLLKGARKGEINGSTIKTKVIDVARFFSFTITYLRTEELLSVDSFSDIPFEIIKFCIERYPGRSDALRRALKFISDPIVQKNVAYPLQWKLSDLESTSIRWSPLPDHVGIPTMPDSLFVFLLSSCAKHIFRFKNLMRMHIAGSPSSIDISPFDPYTFQDAVDFYFEYEGDDFRFTNFHQLFGYPISDLYAEVSNAHSASMTLILLLTGMRCTEIRLMERDCLRVRQGFHFLNSSVRKHRNRFDTTPEGWLAVELVRDAYDILNFFCTRTNSKYIFSSFISHHRNSERAYTPSGLNVHLNRWINKIDVDGIFSEWLVSTHQFRETLVYQLARQEVGLAFISVHLKHFRSRLDRLPNEVTAEYGHYVDDLLKSIQKRKVDAREAVLIELYGENATLAGGGAERHKAKTDAFFVGMGLFGEDRELYIRQMARRGVPLMPTSIGACTYNFEQPKDSPKPRCFGDYGCDPNCENHVISTSCRESLRVRRDDALARAGREVVQEYKIVWRELADTLHEHIDKLDSSARSIA